MAKRTPEKVIPISYPTCGDCTYWHDREEKSDDEVRECYLNPPHVHIDEEGYAAIRPIVERSERACSHFKGAQ